MQVETRGEFGGLGIEVTMEEGLIKVVTPIDETPAARAGIMANDIITHLDEEPMQGLTLDQAVEKMRGPANTKIKLKIIVTARTSQSRYRSYAKLSACARCVRSWRAMMWASSVSLSSTSRQRMA